MLGELCKRYPRLDYEGVLVEASGQRGTRHSTPRSADAVPADVAQVRACLADRADPPTLAGLATTVG